MRLDVYHHNAEDGSEAVLNLLNQILHMSNTNMATILEAIAEVQAANAAGTQLILDKVAEEKAQLAVLIGEKVAEAVITRDAMIADLQAQLAAGSTVTPEQIAALKAPFDDLAVAIQEIVQPAAPVV